MKRILNKQERESIASTKTFSSLKWTEVFLHIFIIKLCVSADINTICYNLLQLFITYNITYSPRTFVNWTNQSYTLIDNASALFLTFWAGIYWLETPQVPGDQTYGVLWVSCFFTRCISILLIMLTMYPAILQIKLNGISEKRNSGYINLLNESVYKSTMKCFDKYTWKNQLDGWFH